MLQELQAEMIKSYKISILFFLIAIGCAKNASDLDVKTVLIKYQLSLDNSYDFSNINWNCKMYTNRNTDSCLIILINKKGDTILTHLDKGIESWYRFKLTKIDKQDFIIKRDFPYIEMDSTKPDYNPKESYSYNDIDYPMDHYYRLDSINKKLEVVKLISKLEIEKRIKEKFHFKEKIKILA